MNNNLKILLLVLLTLFITQQNLLAVDPVIVGSDTSIISLACNKKYIVSPYILLVQAGSLIKFNATNEGYSILINNADKYFEGVDQTVTFVIDTYADTPPLKESDIYILKSDLPVGTEIPYTVVCLNSGKIIGGVDDDAPPKIIIVPADDEY